MAPGTNSISRRQSPTDHEPSLFNRLLHRTGSKREQAPSTGKQAFPPPKTGPPQPKSHEQGCASSTEPPRPSPQPVPQAPPTISTMGAPTANVQSTHTLKKRASIRDRLRSLVRDTPRPPAEPEKQRIVYVPTHAAADFSRLASPKPSSRQQLRYYYDEPSGGRPPAAENLNAVTTHRDEHEFQALPTSRHYSPRGLQTLEEDEPAQVTSTQHQLRHRQPEEDTVQPVPVSPPHGHAIRVNGREASPNLTTTLPAPESIPPEPSLGAKGHSEDDAHRPTDYELFLARAEEREQAYRAHLLRTLSQRQYPRQEPEIAAYPHRKSATYTTDSAVVAEASGPLRRGWEGRLSGLDSGIGSKSSSQQGEGSRRPSDEPATTGSSTWDRGHRKHASWTPSFGPGGKEAERKLERGYPAIPGTEVDASHHAAYTTSTSTNNMASFAERSYAAQQPRTVRRQTSIKQRLGEYIKPSKPPSHYDEPELRRSKGKRVI